MIEEWKDIKGYEGLYQVSNFGRVKSKHRGSERILKAGTTRLGYLNVCLCKNNQIKNFKVHRLVAKAFILNPDNKPEVNHIDEDKTNNIVSNLEWCTRKENINHGTRTERSSKKVKAIDIATGEWNEYYSIRECARQLGIHPQNICNCLKGKRKQSGNYVFEYAK
ncbi:endonuclease [Enterococcus phage SSMH01]|nr:endonuclease [Enterococcus phage SSMH01]